MLGIVEGPESPLSTATPPSTPGTRSPTGSKKRKAEIIDFDDSSDDDLPETKANFAMLRKRVRYLEVNKFPGTEVKS